MLENDPVGVCVSPNGKFVYEGNACDIVDPGPMTIRGFKVSSTGILTLVPGSPYFPLGDAAVERFQYSPEVGYPSSMVVAP